MTNVRSTTSLPTTGDFTSTGGTPIVIRTTRGGERAYIFNAANEIVCITPVYVASLTGGGDVSDKLQAYIDYVKANGGILRVLAGVYRAKGISIGGGAAPWGLVCDGSKQVTFEHVDGDGTLFVGAASSVAYTLSGFTVDCKHSTYAHANANHGIAIVDTSGLRLSDIRVRDYKNASILIYASTADTHEDAVVVDCHADGMNAANNGMLIADMNHSGFIRCSAKNIPGSPGYGVQFKNDCRYCFITDGYGNNCVANLAFGNDSGTSGVKYSSVKGFRSLGGGVGFVASYSEYNDIDGLYVDMDGDVQYALDLGAGTFGNSIKATVRNIDATRSAVITRSGATDNTVRLEHVDNLDTSGTIASFSSGSERNTVTLSRMTNPTLRSGGIPAMFSNSGTDNSFVYEAYPTYENRTIASGVITLVNTKTTAVVVDTEGAAASDDLDTITAWAQEGGVLSLRTASNTRDVVVKHNTGNILLNGAADFTLSATADTVTLMYNAGISKWCEIGRGDNA